MRREEGRSEGDYLTSSVIHSSSHTWNKWATCVWIAESNYFPLFPASAFFQLQPHVSKILHRRKFTWAGDNSCDMTHKLHELNLSWRNDERPESTGSDDRKLLWNKQATDRQRPPKENHLTSGQRLSGREVKLRLKMNEWIQSCRIKWVTALNKRHGRWLQQITNHNHLSISTHLNNLQGVKAEVERFPQTPWSWSALRTGSPRIRTRSHTRAKTVFNTEPTLFSFFRPQVFWQMKTWKFNFLGNDWWKTSKNKKIWGWMQQTEDWWSLTRS